MRTSEEGGRTAVAGGATPGAERTRMETPDDVATMKRLRDAGWGARRIAEFLGCARNTVRSYLRQGEWRPYAGGKRAKKLDGHETWVAEQFDRHDGNAEVIREELVRQRGVQASRRTVERAVAGQRRQRQAAAVATMRYETAPGQQIQVDFGEWLGEVGGIRVRVHLCVLTLSWSRRTYVQAFTNEQQANWLLAMEGAFRHFGGVPEEILLDNARALVKRHDARTREVEFNERFLQFTTWWRIRPRACAPYRAQTKGKDESGVKYVKRNALAGRSFASWAALEAWLATRMREVADVRIHGTTGEAPIVRFTKGEAGRLRALEGRPPFQAERELVRVVHHDACVEVEGNWYTVPWRLVKETVSVRLDEGTVRVLYGGEEVARHPRATGRRERVVDPAHWQGLVGRRPVEAAPAPDEYVRPLDVYAALVDEVAA